ncbi:MAG: phospho-N-acetylmuramoyl-pentapeptide-transferase [Candidatus Faecousia sp.]|nr:phospho-N-acetylmuramoyl-pentapeptide-transferase [Clostridiales bacterium]MDD7651800.1 phospho-N-acetylmuramoyl-pentapeptide-transferase [Bacillota bacterium]MDY4219395.1 phospho-N-acetylmuramoyl-pentapeptide-transferase [Candidatus Faecousia sp.]
MDTNLIYIGIAILCAFALGLLLGYILIPALRRLKAGQEIREVGPNWHATKAGTPTMGGLTFIGASLLCLVFGFRHMRQGDFSALYVLVLSLCFGLIGFLDDLFKVKYHRNLGLTALQKAMLQMAVSGIFLYVLYRAGLLTCELYVPFVNVTWEIHPVPYMIFDMFIMVGCVNAVNLTDGIDGLATGVTMPVMAFFTLVAIAARQWNLALFPATLLGGLGAFLTYNFHPAKAFMGDTGSLFLGGAVCGLAFALDIPLILILVGLVYIVETLSDIIQVTYFKLTHGKRIFKMAPIHHHFEMCGWSEEKIFTVFVSVTCIMCVLAWFGLQGRF